MSSEAPNPASALPCRPELAVGAIVLRAGDGGLEVLLIRRGKEPNRGAWSLPGGRVERGESLADATAREVREEASVEIDVHALVEPIELISARFHYVVMDYLATPKEPASDPRAGDDADDARWVATDALAPYALTPALLRVIEGGVAMLAAMDARGARDEG